MSYILLATKGYSPKILEAFAQRTDREHFAKLIDNKTIEENDYNLAVSSYVAGEDIREVVNIKELNEDIAKMVARQKELRAAIDEIVREIER